jgi:hypothetical protein
VLDHRHDRLIGWQGERLGFSVVGHLPCAPGCNTGIDARAAVYTLESVAAGFEGVAFALGAYGAIGEKPDAP